MGQEAVLLGTRSPHWACNCGRAGADEIWACRVKCRGCGRPAPEGIQRKAKAEDAKVREARKAADAKAKSGGRGSDGEEAKVAQLGREIKKLEASSAWIAPHMSVKLLP